nr:hypothetical protein B0A51_16794 [Rachicladosporium sp. CCFEE 5018]
MRLTSLPLLAAVSCVAHAAATAPGYVYVFDPSREASQQVERQTLSPAVSRLVMAQRAGVEEFHIDRALNKEEIDAINTYGSSTPLLGRAGQTGHAFLLAFYENVQDIPATSSFNISPAPKRRAGQDLFDDLQTQSDPRYPHERTLFDHIIRVSNGNMFFFASDTTSLETTFAQLRDEATWHITALVLPWSTSARLGHDEPIWGTYRMPKAESPLQLRQAELRHEKRQVLPYDPEEPLAEPSYHQSLSDNTTDPLQIFKSNNTQTRPLGGILPACFSSLSACQTTTRNCTGHGSCSLKYTDKDAGSGLGACYSCACQASVVTTDGKKKTTTWGGPACQKRDVSVEFWLIVLFTVGLIFVVGFAVGTVWEMGSEELPSVIGAGVSGPVRKSSTMSINIITSSITLDAMAMEEGDLWLFGYGEDHRGTPEQPGRVVTLIDRQLWETLTDQHPSAPPQVQGAAYRIPSRHVAEVKAYLDIREINGYSMHYTPFHVFTSGRETSTGSMVDENSRPVTPIQCLVYIGTPDNPQFLGPQDPQALAERIAMCRGPSGENREYLFMLEEALRGLHGGEERDGVVDEHVTDLAARVRALIRE